MRRNKIDIDVGKRVRELRERRNYTREDLAEKIEISSKFLYEIEMGRKGFSIAVLRRIAEELSVSCDYIIFGEGAENCDRDAFARSLRTLRPMQARRIQDILNILFELCNSL
ncbi:MAG: helix-turn-helix domain-containing protein [Roseburia sp.]